MGILLSAEFARTFTELVGRSEQPFPLAVHPRDPIAVEIGPRQDIKSRDD
jgi:hypothetical protein